MYAIHYPVEIQKFDQDYIVKFPDFPGSFACAGTEKDALYNAVGCLETRIKMMLESGGAIPEENTADSDACDTVALSPGFAAYLMGLRRVENSN